MVERPQFKFPLCDLKVKYRFNVLTRNFSKLSLSPLGLLVLFAVCWFVELIHVTVYSLGMYLILKRAHSLYLTLVTKLFHLRNISTNNHMLSIQFESSSKSQMEARACFSGLFLCQVSVQTDFPETASTFPFPQRIYISWNPASLQTLYCVIGTDSQSNQHQYEDRSPFRGIFITTSGHK